MTDRYAGRPLLRLVECYVLDAIGELPDADRTRLESMAPEIAQSLHSPAETWQGAIAGALELDDEYGDSLRQDWADNSRSARDAGSTLTPQSFAETVADWFDV
jgi:hypothetical protein